MNEKIVKSLEKLFERHRIVFWYDSNCELRSEFAAIEFDDVEKIELCNNEYGVKYRILRELPEQKFLLYHEGPQPADLDNWLLDVLLAHGDLRTDQAAIWLSELELGPEFLFLVQEHGDFFRSEKRKQTLKELLKAEDSLGAVRLKMLAVCAGSEVRLEAVLENLLRELVRNSTEKINLIERCGLANFLWEQLRLHYDYNPEIKSISDFAIELFKSCYYMFVGGKKPQLNTEALVFFKHWKDNRLFSSDFEYLSGEYAQTLDIEQDLNERDFRELLELDFFLLVEQKIISELIKIVLAQTFSANEILAFIRQRRQSYWYEKNRDLYQAIGFAAQFMQTLAESDLNMTGIVDGVMRYRDSWHKLDFFYRKFIYYVCKVGPIALMEALFERMENLYVNNFLLKVNNLWQSFVDGLDEWEVAGLKSQKSFFDFQVNSFHNKKVCVIISDALRYEVGHELLGLIQQEKGYKAEIDCMLAMLPTYTQLGMAALLPHNELSIGDNGNIFVDGQASAGLESRCKILQNGLLKDVLNKDRRATVLQAKELLNMKQDDCRSLVREHDIIYIYHNHIDATGDNRDTEERVFGAVEETIKELLIILRRMVGANAANFLLCADHGFIYQHREIEQSDYAGSVESGKVEYLYKNRRFLLGKNLPEQPGLKKFTAKQLGLEGDLEVQLPKSINRLRLSGSGSRFVHGGAALQEVVIPLLTVNKSRQKDISCVKVDIIGSEKSVITSGQIGVNFYQSEPVTEKVKARRLRAAIYNASGELISDVHILDFDSPQENPREREQQVRFILSRQAESSNGQDVFLKLEEQVEGTSQYTGYKSQRYTMRRSFSTDFDF
jgi:uncharacterized protein (TIGR02687 family)